MLESLVVLGAVTYGQPADAAPSAPARTVRSEAGGYIEIPLRGEFGKEITAPGIRDAMRAAKQKKAEAVVLVFDTPGGRVADAQAIAATIDKERASEKGGPELKVYAVVLRAISASVWPLAHSDRIFFAPGAAAGAAVAFHWDLKSGNAEVDAKFNAAVAAEVASAAEAHGQAGCVYRAMMLQESKLYGWATANGYKVSDARPTEAVKELEELDTATTVLAWTTTQAAKYGFGTVMPSRDVAGLGPLLGVKEWHSAGDLGGSAMTRAAREIERKTADTERAKEAIETSRQLVLDTAERIVSTGKLAAAADPAKSVTVRTTSTGQFSAQSQVDWRAQTDKAIQQWNAVINLLGDLERAERQAAHAVDNYNAVRTREHQSRLYAEKVEPLKLKPVEHDIDAKVVRPYASDAISRLTANRMKTHL